MIEKTRWRCPCCGMIADKSRLDSPTPYKIQIFLQKFGGKVPGNNKGRGKAKGFMKYTDVTKSHSDIVLKIRERLNELGND
jgi:hypothetical protein